MSPRSNKARKRSRPRSRRSISGWGRWRRAASGLAKADALDALAGRVGALEAAKAGDVAKSALDAAQAAKTDAAKALDLAESAPPPAAASAGPDASALASRLDALDQRLAKLEGASSVAKSEARLTPTESAATGDAAVVAVLGAVA